MFRTLRQRSRGCATFRSTPSPRRPRPISSVSLESLRIMRIELRTVPRFILSLTLLAVMVAAAVPARAQDLYEDFVLAVANDRAREVRSLLARGIDPDTVDKRGDPVVVVAARAGNRETVQALLEGGAKVNKPNIVGDTAIMVAALNGHIEIVRMLRARRASIDSDTPTWTPLMYAAT